MTVFSLNGNSADQDIAGTNLSEFLKEVDQRIFGGSAYRRVPKKDIGLETLYEL